MDHDIVLLFARDEITSAEPHHARSSGLSTTAAGRSMQIDENECGGIELPMTEQVGHSVVDSGLPFGMLVDTHAEDTVRALSRECELLEDTLAQQKKAYKELERRVYKRAVMDIDLPAELMRRLRQLESESERQKSENKRLREDLSVAEGEVALLRNEVAGQKNKVKGAGKKMRNAKDVATQQEEKAKHAVHDKQLRVSSERKMKLERNEAVAKVASLTKLCDDLQSNLDVETAGRPHLRKGDTSSDEGIAVVPIEISIRRTHYQSLLTIFECNQTSITEQMQRWYNDWKEPKTTSQCTVSATYIDHKKSGDDPGVDSEKLYADMVELVDGHQQTAAEHNGPCSWRSLAAVCRKAEERHNCQD